MLDIRSALRTLRETIDRYVAVRREYKLVHKTRRTWLASGVSMDNRDLGTWEIPNATRGEAMKIIADRVPRAAIVHVCDIHWMITYRV